MVHVVPQGDLVFAEKPPVKSNYTPNAVDEYIDVLEFGQNNELFLATSSLNRRSWTGDLWWFENAEDVPDVEKARTGYRIDSGIAKVKCINANQLVMALDSGALQLVRVNKNKNEARDTIQHYFEMHPSYCEHDDRISDLDVWRSDGEDVSNLVITGGMDGRIIVWDKNMGIPHSYSPAHPSGVISVSCNQEQNSVFASAGLEGSIKVWDTKENKPCRTIFNDPHLPPAQISWLPSQQNLLLVATKTGKVFVLDTTSGKKVAEFCVMDREIRTIRWSVDRPELCALAGDDVTVHVIKVTTDKNSKCSISTIYSKDSHRDFVRGLAWHPVSGVLWSSGWDKQVLPHTIQQS